jgi:hypothetical protein
MKAAWVGTVAALFSVGALSLGAQSSQTKVGGRPPVTEGAAIAHYTAKAPLDGDPTSPSKIDILIERWSTDKERDLIASSLPQGSPEALLTALQGIRVRAGVLLMPGVPGLGARARIRHPLNVYFAREVETSKGRQVVLGIDRPLAFGQPTVKWPDGFAVSLVDIRFAADGTGIGKVGESGRIAFNEKTQTLEVADYASAPSRLVDVRTEKP